MTKENNPSLAIAISLYNRWDELGGLLELLRLNWKGGQDLHISVVSTAKERDFPAWIDKSFIDYLDFGSAYPVVSTPGWSTSPYLKPLRKNIINYYSTQRKRVIRTRTVDNIIRGCRQCANTDKTHTLHLHAAAWPLKEDKIYEVLNTMKRKNCVIAGRGYGKKLIDAKHPDGDIDDNFFIIDNSFAKQVDFWNFDPAQNANHVCNEGQLAQRCAATASPDQIYWYDDFSNPKDYMFPLLTEQRRVQPYNYHRPLGLLRSHDLSKQAQLCKKLGISGPIINQMIAEEEKKK